MASETIRIKARSTVAGFRRAGIKFSSLSAEYDVDGKTLKVLQAEPMLVVEVLPEEKKEPGKDKTPGKEKTPPGEAQAGKKDK
jgi:hypothetical protein